MRRLAWLSLLVITARAASATVAGDSNRDGRVSAPDVTALVQILAGAPGSEGADANLDGFILSDDLDATVARLFDARFGEATPTPPPTASQTPTPPATTSPSPTVSPTRSATRSPTPTPTASASHTARPSTTPTNTIGSTPSATHTPGSNPVAESVAGSVIVVANGMTAIPSIVTALVSGLEFGDGAAAERGGAAGACPLGGTATRSCPTFNTTMTITLAGCTVATASGSVTINGTITASGGGFCPLVLPPWNATIEVTAVFRDQAGAQLLTTQANLTGTVNPQLGGSCSATGVSMMLSGTTTTTFPGGPVASVMFQNTSVAVAVAQFSQQCVPTDYSLTFNGPATISNGGLGGGAAGDEPFAVVFGNFVVRHDATVTPSKVYLDGGITAACYGGTITVQTFTPLTQALGQACPTGGTLKVTAPSGMAQLLYMPGGMVGIDTNLDGLSDQTFPSCLDAALLLCFEQNGSTATPTPSRTLTATEAPTQSPTGTDTAAPTATPTPPLTPTVTQPPPASPTATLMASPTPSLIASPPPTPTFIASATPSLATPTEFAPSPSATPSPPATLTDTPSPTATLTATLIPSSTPSAIFTASTTPSFTTTATPTPSRSATPSPSAPLTATSPPTATLTPVNTEATFCDPLTLPVSIPDNNAVGITRDIVIAGQIAIADLNVRLDVTHPFVGDLKVSLTHVTTGTTAVLLDRPGIPPSQFGCNGNNIACEFDDAAGRAAESQCLPSAAPIPSEAIDGSVMPLTPLSVFAGQTVAGTWRLNVSDNAQGDTGTLLGWCLDVNSTAPVVTQFSCQGTDDCTILINAPYTLTFSFIDPNGNASAWNIQAIRDDGQIIDVAGGPFASGQANGTIPVQFLPFTCPAGNCRETAYDFVVLVTDLDGKISRATRVHVVVPAS